MQGSGWGKSTIWLCRMTLMGSKMKGTKAEQRSVAFIIGQEVLSDDWITTDYAIRATSREVLVFSSSRIINKATLW